MNRIPLSYDLEVVLVCIRMEDTKPSIAIAHLPIYIHFWVRKYHVLWERRLLDEEELVIIGGSELLVRFSEHRERWGNVEEDSLPYALGIVDA